MDENKKKIAAITAVLSFLQEEKEATQQEQQARTAVPTGQDTFWTFSGRQSQMMIRNMAQMRLFPGWKS